MEPPAAPPPVEEPGPNDVVVPVGAMPLLIAAEQGLREEVEALVKGGCDVDKADDDGTTPLLKAAEEGHGKVVEALIKGGCDVDNATNEGVTQLLMAALEGHAEVVEALVKGGCDVDKDKNKGCTPLYIAAEVGHGEVVEALLMAGCDTSSVSSVRDGQVRGLFVAHHAEQQRKMLAMAGGLHARLGAGSRVFTLDNNLLMMIWEQVERWCAVPPEE